MSGEYSIYLHIPFCRHRCSYCDFNTYAGQDHARSAYVGALCAEIRQVSQSAPDRLPVHTVFFGGGTPSLLAEAEVNAVLETLSACFDLSPTVEISLEANPGTLSLPYLKSLRQAGVNRLSMGMQSSHPADLRVLERQHDFFEVIQSVKWARQAGFDNLSLDLMFALPEQSLQRWQTTLDHAIQLQVEHLSLYALTLEHGTPFQHWTERGLIPEADPDLAADMYEWAMDRLEQAGLTQYEISNWAKPDGTGGILSCRHNLQYWNNLPYLGFGAGAHGFAAGFRPANVLGIKAYIQRCSQGTTRQDGEKLVFPLGPAVANATPIDPWTEVQETMMVGLRLTQEGVSARGFEQRFGMSLQETFKGEIERLLNFGLLEWVGDNGQEALRLTRHGRLLGNQVFVQFISQ